MNTLNGYSKSTLTDLYVLTASGGHFPLIPTLDTLLSEINSVASKKCFPHLVSEQIDTDVISSNYIYTDALSVAGLIISTVTDVAPFIINSAAKIGNLNVDRVDGYHIEVTSSPGTDSSTLYFVL